MFPGRSLRPRPGNVVLPCVQQIASGCAGEQFAGPYGPAAPLCVHKPAACDTEFRIRTQVSTTLDKEIK
jgi:hypothetical protein